MTFYKTSPACGMAHEGLPMLWLPSFFDSQDQHSWARKINVQNKNKTKIKALFRWLLGYISTTPRNLWGRGLLSISGWYMEEPLGFMICPDRPIKAPSAFLYLTAVGLHWRTKHTQKKTFLCSGPCLREDSSEHRIRISWRGQESIYIWKWWVLFLVSDVDQ